MLMALGITIFKVWGKVFTGIKDVSDNLRSELDSGTMYFSLKICIF